MKPKKISCADFTRMLANLNGWHSIGIKEDGRMTGIKWPCKMERERETIPQLWDESNSRTLECYLSKVAGFEVELER